MYKGEDYMRTNLWVKTILYVYKYLDSLAEAIDKLVERQALNSFYYYSGLSEDNGVMAVSERIINLIDRKKRLINIKVLTDKSLENCDSEYAQILIERYIDNDKSEEIAFRHGYAMRTYFRKLSQAEEQCASKMSQMGFTSEKLEKYLAGEKWITEIYQAFSSKEIDKKDFLEIEKD